MRFLLPILAVLLAPLWAAGENFVPVGVSDGLGNRKVYQVCQDADGYLWFYTQSSIDRYDGFEFKHYFLGREATEGGYLATENTLTVDAEGILHVVQTNGKVYRYNRRSDSFELAFSLEWGTLFALLFDGGTTWLGTSLGLVALEDGNILFAECAVNCIAREGNLLYIGTDEGLYIYDGLACVREESVPEAKVTAVLPLGDGQVFIGTFADGAFRIPAGRLAAHPLPDAFSRVPVRKIIRDGGSVLFGLDGAGVVVWDISSACISGFYTDSDAGGLCAGTVSDLYCDRSGTLWVTTTTNGICYSNPGPLPVKWIRRSGSGTLESDHINNILQDSKGRIWFATNKGLSRMEGDNWRNFKAPGADVILMLAEGPDGTVWAGGYGCPVFSVDASDRITILDREQFHYVFSLAVNGNDLWIGDLNDPLTRIDLVTGEQTSYGAASIWALYPQGRMWIASHSGLGNIGADDSIEWLPLPEGLSGSWCITSDRSGRIWAGMETGGIVCYDPSDGILQSYPLDKTIMSIIADESGMIWAASEDYIYRLDPARGVPVVMNRFLGIDSGAFNHTAAARLQDGRLAFGTVNGAFVFDPAMPGGGETSAVTPVLTGFKLLSGDSTSLLKGLSINELDFLPLKWEQRSFDLSYSALKMSGQERVLFEYQLKGYDAAPRQSLSAGSVEYSNLPAGKYSFVVRAVDVLTGEVLGTRELKIQVFRPIMRSNVAVCIYVVLAALLSLWLVQTRRKQRLRRMTQDRLDTFIFFAHELKTPVSLIKAPLSALDKDPLLPSEEKESVSTALRNTDRLMNMINSLLDLRGSDTSQKPLTLELCDARDYLGETLNAFIPAARHKGIDLSYSVEGGLENILIDRDKMDHILQNLVSNAVKYTEKGSVCVIAAPAGRSWKLTVQDTGIGIPAEARSRIFYGGIRAANARSVDETGYGIGLMITRQLVDQHRGSMAFSSEEGAGTTFTLTFPIDYKASGSVVLPPLVEEQAQEEPGQSAQTACILIVEDDDEMLRYLRELLQVDYDIHTVPDGDAALRAAEEVQPDLVLTDVVMPGMNGYDLCRQLKSSLTTSHIPVILLTAMDDREHVIMGLESGSDDYIVKPFDPQVLRARVNNLLVERERLRLQVLQSGRREKQREYTNRLDKEFMEKVLTVMESSYSDSEFQIDDLCRSVAMSRTAFFNKLKALTGTGPNDFIRIYRLERAKELLESGQYTIAEVSDKVGFSDAKYFSSCFKKAFGVSPSKY